MDETGAPIGPEDPLKVPRFAGRPVLARLPRRDEVELLDHREDLVRELTLAANELERRIASMVSEPAPTVRDLAGVGALTAAKIVAEVADVRRFDSTDRFARHNGTAPLPVRSGNRIRHRLSRTGNRRLNAAIHRIAITQMRGHDGAKTYLERRFAMGNTRSEALRALKRHLSDIVYRALLADAETAAPAATERAA